MCQFERILAHGPTVNRYARAHGVEHHPVARDLNTQHRTLRTIDPEPIGNRSRGRHHIRERDGRQREPCDDQLHLGADPMSERVSVPKGRASHAALLNRPLQCPVFQSRDRGPVQAIANGPRGPCCRQTAKDRRDPTQEQRDRGASERRALNKTTGSVAAAAVVPAQAGTGVALNGLQHRVEQEAMMGGHRRRFRSSTGCLSSCSARHSPGISLIH